MTSNRILIFLVFVLFCGCETTTSTPPSQNDSRPDTELRGEMDPRFYEAPPNDSLSKRLNKARSERFDLKSKKIRKVFRETENWKQADQQVRTLIGDSSRLSPVVTKEFGADLMLRKHLLRGEMTTEKWSAIAHYTKILLDSNNPQADLLADALDRLQGKWSAPKIQEAAQNAIGPAQRKLDSLKNGSMVTRLREAKSQQGAAGKGATMLLDGLQKRANDIEGGIARLELLAHGK